MEQCSLNTTVVIIQQIWHYRSINTTQVRNSKKRVKQDALSIRGFPIPYIDPIKTTMRGREEEEVVSHIRPYQTLAGHIEEIFLMMMIMIMEDT